MMKAGLIDEMMNDAIDSALDGEDIEEETEEQLNQVTAQGAGVGGL
jgi:charged multivesicular body protein 3